MNDIFRNEILPGEHIQWRGQPDPSSIFCAADLFMIPFSLMWGGFAIFWELTALGIAGPEIKPGHEPPAFFPLFGIPFVLIGLYVIMGRFFYKAYKKRNTYYAVTDRRVIVLYDGFRRNVQAATFESAARGLSPGLPPRARSLP